MTEENRLNTVWNDSFNSDNDLLIRVLNTFLENGEENSAIILDSILYFTALFNNLLSTRNIKRKDIEFVVNRINQVQLNPSFDNYVALLEEIYDKDMSNYKYLYLLCYCRSRFELFYLDRVIYKNPKYAIQQGLGDNPWIIFLKALKNKEYLYM